MAGITNTFFQRSNFLPEMKVFSTTEQISPPTKLQSEKIRMIPFMQIPSRLTPKLAAQLKIGEEGYMGRLLVLINALQDASDPSLHPKGGSAYGLDLKGIPDTLTLDNPRIERVVNTFLRSNQSLIDVFRWNIAHLIARK